jgi:prolyl 4-hydroxylase
MITPYLNVLNPQECSEIINNSVNNLTPMLVGAGKDNEGVLSPDRSAEGFFLSFSPLPPLIQKIQHIVSEVTGLPIENQESPNVIRYQKGGQYREHHDYIGDYTKNEDCGDRKYSCLFYLNTDFKGGETYFPYFNLKIGPTIGTLLKWDNLLPSGEGNLLSRHSGLPVIEGEKWILVIWVREKSNH